MGINRFLMVAVALVGFAANGMTQKTTTLKSNAFFVQNNDNSLFESLDLKRENVSFTASDFDTCAKKMLRVKDTLHYTCTMTLPSGARISRRHSQITPVVMMIPYAGQDRHVFITVSDDAKSVIYSTEFDAVGFDLEINKFNDDFYNVYGKAAVNVIAEAMKKSLVLEVLENHGNKKVATSN